MSKIKKAIIPAAGLGTRFLPITKSQPKEMLNIIDKPTLQYVVEEASKSGIEDILIILNRNKESIVNHFDANFELEKHLLDKEKYDELKSLKKLENLANIYYIRQDIPKGLGHAISLGRSFVGDEPFAVLLGDELMLDNGHGPVTKQLIDAYERKTSPIIGMRYVDDSDLHRYGIINPGKTQDGLVEVLDLKEKPNLEEAASNIAVLGRYILPPDIFDVLEVTPIGKDNEIQLTDAIAILNKTTPVYGHMMECIRFDLGSKTDFIKAIIYLSVNNPEYSEEIKDYMKKLI